MVFYHSTFGGAADIINRAETKEEKAILLALLRELIKDTKGTLEVHKNDIKMLKDFKHPVFELRKPRDYRIFYILDGNDMTILEVIKKKKNHTEGRYIKILKDRLKSENKIYNNNINFRRYLIMKKGRLLSREKVKFKFVEFKFIN